MYRHGMFVVGKRQFWLPLWRIFGTTYRRERGPPISAAVRSAVVSASSPAIIVVCSLVALRLCAMIFNIVP